MSLLEYPALMMQEAPVMAGYLNISQCQALCDDAKASLNNHLVMFLGVNSAYWAANYLILRYKPEWSWMSRGASVTMMILTLILLMVT